MNMKIMHCHKINRRNREVGVSTWRAANAEKMRRLLCPRPGPRGLSAALSVLPFNRAQHLIANYNALTRTNFSESEDMRLFQMRNEWLRHMGHIQQAL